jgi:tRNA threonylcarbamoyladenosine biosynthesis protein TsaB
MDDSRATGGNRRAPVVLAFDTAGSACSVAVGRGNRVLAHERQEMRHGHAEALLPMIARATGMAGVGPAEIGLVAVSVGPGGFTGIRAGLAAAQGLALATGAELVGVTSFTAVAARLPAGHTPLLVALDSRRADFYAALFDAGLSPLGGPVAVMPDALAAWVTETLGNCALRVAGDAADAARVALGRDDIEVFEVIPDALGVLFAAARSESIVPARPLYLREPDVSFPRRREVG